MRTPYNPTYELKHIFAYELTTYLGGDSGDPGVGLGGPGGGFLNLNSSSGLPLLLLPLKPPPGPPEPTPESPPNNF